MKTCWSFQIDMGGTLYVIFDEMPPNGTVIPCRLYSLCQYWSGYLYAAPASHTNVEGLIAHKFL